MAYQDGYLSDLVGRSAVLPNGTTIGRVTDFVVGKPDDAFPRIDGFVIKTKAGQRYSPIAQIGSIEPHGTVTLTVAPEAEPAAE